MVERLTDAQREAMEAAYTDFYGEAWEPSTDHEDLRVSREAWASAFIAGALSREDEGEDE